MPAGCHGGLAPGFRGCLHPSLWPLPPSLTPASEHGVPCSLLLALVQSLLALLPSVSPSQSSASLFHLKSGVTPWDALGQSGTVALLCGLAASFHLHGLSATKATHSQVPGTEDFGGPLLCTSHMVSCFSFVSECFRKFTELPVKTEGQEHRHFYRCYRLTVGRRWDSISQPVTPAPC